MDRVAVGVGVRDAYLEPLTALRDRRALDVLEVMIDDALPEDAAAQRRREAWRRLGARWPLVAHGTELGIADAGGVAKQYVERVQRSLAELHIHWYSEHLSFLRAGGLFLGHFAPIEDDDETLSVLARNAALVRGGCPCPLLLENPADVLGAGAQGPDAGARLGRAFGRALVAAGAGALLDLTNLVLNARNEGYDPGAFLAALPWERVVQVHLAGGHVEDGLWIDSHAHAIDEEALGLLLPVARQASSLRAVIIERDERLPALQQLLSEVEAARGVLAKAGRS